MSAPKQSPRQPGDGGVEVRRVGDTAEQIAIYVTTRGETESMTISEYNAARVLAMLSVILEIPLSAASAKAVKL